MAAATVIFQQFFPVYPGRKLSVTKVKLVDTSNTFTLPLAIVAQGSASVGQVRSQNENQISSVSQHTTTGVVTLSNNAIHIGKTVTVVGLHVDSNATTVG